MRGHSSKPFSQTTSALPGSASSVVTGAAIGLSEGSKAIHAALGISSEKLAQRDSLLAALNKLAEEVKEPAAVPSLGLYKDAGLDFLEDSAKAIATGAERASKAPATLLSHILQLPMDASVATRAVTKALPQSGALHSEASVFDAAAAEGGLSANARSLTDNVGKMVNALSEQIDKELKNGGVEGSHATAAKLTGGASLLPSIAATAAVAGAMDAIGSVFRELSAAMHFSKAESASEGEKNIYLAFSNCCTITGKNTDEAMKALKDLEQALSNFKAAEELSNKQSVSSPTLSVLTRLLATAPLLSAIRSLHDSTVATKALAASVNDSKKFTQLNASTFDPNAERSGLSASNRALTDNIGAVIAELEKNIKNQLGDGSIDQTHAVFARATAALPLLASASAVALVASGIDAIGSVFRELSALSHFSQAESKNENEKNIYHLLQQCSLSTAGQNSRQSLQNLNKLEQALSHFKAASELGEKQAVSSPSVSVLIRLLASAPVISALRAFNTSAIAISVVNAAVTKEKENLGQHSKITSTQASAINTLGSEGENSHSRNITQLSQDFDNVLKNINEALEGIENKSDRSAIAGSATVSARMSSAIAMVPNLLIASVGMLSREMAGTADFITNDKGVKAESSQVLKSRADEFGADLDALMNRVSQLKERLERAKELGVSAPVLMGVSHLTGTGGLVVSLNSVAGMCFALRECRNFSDPQNVPTNPNEEEKQVAENYKNKLIASNQDSAGQLGTRSFSDNLSMHEKLQSVMEKVVLIHRSRLNFLEPGQDRRDINSTGKSLIALSQGNSAGFVAGSLGILSLVAMQSGMSAESFLQAIRMGLERCDKLSGGPDKIRLCGLEFNVSSASNATRLSAQAMQDSAVSKAALSTTHQVSESAMSRALTVALIHSGALTAAIKQLVAVEKEKHVAHENFADSAFISAAIMDQLADKIVAVLKNAQGENAPIPGVDADMASQLASASKASIMTALSAHSIMIAPILQSYAVAKKASVIEDNIINDGVTDNVISAVVSKGSNIIQAFTQNCIKQFRQNANTDNAAVPAELKNNAWVSTQGSSNQSTAATMVAASCVSLLCEEIIESAMSRSLGLLDNEKLKKSFNQAIAISSQESTHAKNEIAADSHSNQPGDSTYTVSALRLIVSRLGQAIAEIGSQLEKDSKHDDFDLQKADLKLHSSQRSLMHSLSHSLSQCSVNLLQIAGALSVLPLTAVGVVDQLKLLVQELDNSIQFHRSNSGSEAESKKDSEISLPTGMVSDASTDIVVALVKSMLKASLMGIDTVLAVAKVMEILALHQRPDVALLLETRGLSQPNGLIKNSGAASAATLVGSSAILGSVAAATRTDADFDTSDTTKASIDSSQRDNDLRIEECQLLEDTEEAPEDEQQLGLKKFCEILVSILGGDKINEAGRKQLVARYDMGGFDLSSYHSTYKNHGKNKPLLAAENEVVAVSEERLLGCNDAAQLLDVFINRAVDAEIKPAADGITLADKLLTEIRKYDHVSSKAQRVLEFARDCIADRLYQRLMNPIMQQRATQPKQALFTRPTAAQSPDSKRKAFLEKMNAQNVNRMGGP